MNQLKTLLPEPEAPKEPDLGALLEAERAERAKLQERFAGLEGHVTALQSVAARPVQVSVPEPPMEEPDEPEISDEEYVTNPRQAVRRQAEFIADQKVRQVAANASRMISSLYESTHAAEMSALRAEEFYGDIAPLLEEHFQRNPQARVPGAAKAAYEALVGRHAKELFERRSARGMEQNAGTSAQLPTSRTATVSVRPALPVPAEQPKPAELHPVEAEIMRQLNKLGAGLTPDELEAIKTKKVNLPGRSAFDRLGTEQFRR